MFFLCVSVFPGNADLFIDSVVRLGEAPGQAHDKNASTSAVMEDHDKVKVMAENKQDRDILTLENMSDRRDTIEAMERFPIDYKKANKRGTTGVKLQVTAVVELVRDPLSNDQDALDKDNGPHKSLEDGDHKLVEDGDCKKMVKVDGYKNVEDDDDLKRFEENSHKMGNEEQNKMGEDECRKMTEDEGQNECPNLVENECLILVDHQCLKIVEVECHNERHKTKDDEGQTMVNDEGQKTAMTAVVEPELVSGQDLRRRQPGLETLNHRELSDEEDPNYSSLSFLV
jgi:hypothetical protein